MAGRRESFIVAVYSKILPLIVSVLVIVGASWHLLKAEISKIEITGIGEAFSLIGCISLLILAAIALFGFYQIALTKDIKDLLAERSPKERGNPKEVEKKGEEKKEERIETSGAGAFVGMVIGGALGLAFGPAGVICGGILGGFIGNQIEDESERARRKR